MFLAHLEKYRVIGRTRQSLKLARWYLDLYPEAQKSCTQVFMVKTRSWVQGFPKLPCKTVIHRIVRTFHGHLVHSLQWAETFSARSGCSELCAALSIFIISIYPSSTRKKENQTTDRGEITFKESELPSSNEESFKLLVYKKSSCFICFGDDGNGTNY